MAVADVRTALMNAALAVWTSEPLSKSADLFSAENFPTVETDTDWCLASFLPSTPAVATMGPGGADQLRGLLQVGVRSPLQQGAAFGLTVLDRFRASLPAGTRLTFNGQQVEIVSVGAVLGIVRDAWYRTDIEVRFRAFLTRG